MRGPVSRWGAALAVLAALATAALAAGCGSGSSSSTASATTRTSTTTVVTTSTASSTASPTATASSTSTAPQAGTAAVPAGCTPAHTAVSVARASAATGHAGVVLRFRNSGSTACTLTGYPGAALVAPHRQLDAVRTPQGFMGGLSPSARANPVVRLAPGDEASAFLEGEDFNPQTSGACPRYTALLVTPPNQTVTVRLHRSLGLCNPQIHPVVPGTSGRQQP